MRHWPALTAFEVGRYHPPPRVGAPSLHIAARGVTDVGRRREQNEDAFLVDEELGLFVVADGMGGHAGGGTASRLAVETIRKEVRAVRGGSRGRRGRSRAGAADAVAGLLRDAVQRASHAIYQAAQSDPDLSGMGTTVTAALLDGDQAYLAHVGDSRCYLARRDRIYQVSEDHSLVNEQLKAGSITPEEARNSRFRNIITRSVGFEDQVSVDLHRFAVEPGDALVLCCDGLSNLVEDHEIREIATGSPVGEAPGKMVALANDRGGDDNITAIVVRLESGS
jgi:protein phosphatase